MVEFWKSRIRGRRKEAKISLMTSNEELGAEEETGKISSSSEEEDSRSISKEECPGNSSDGSTEQNSPRGVFDIQTSSVDSDGGSSSEISSLERSSSTTASPVLEHHSSQWRNLIGGLLLRKKKSMMMRLSTFPPATASSDLGRSVMKAQSDVDDPMEKREEIEIPRGKPSWRSFDYQELAAATDNFSPDNLIGKGGHAEVYKGCLPDGQLVAVKRLTKRNTEEERTGDFLSELGIIAHVHHPNAAQLLGFSVEGGLHLVLQFSPHGSLASMLHGSKDGLEWKIRFKIALGIAEGLLYLHEKCQRRIIHRDIKASNILLTEDYQPQISDFGLAKWLPEKWTHHVVFPIEGTFGYMAPEYFMHGIINEKTDVFAFGVLLLELITGRRAVDLSLQSLVIWAKPLLDANNMRALIDPSLGDSCDCEEMKRAVSAASMSIHRLSAARPSMSVVVRLLKGEEGSLELMGRVPRPNIRRPLFDAGDLEEYTCSTYLNDLNRHKQLALEQ